MMPGRVHKVFVLKELERSQTKSDNLIVYLHISAVQHHHDLIFKLNVCFAQISRPDKFKEILNVR